MLCLAAAPVWGQSDPWLAASKAGMQAADEGDLAQAEARFRDAMKLSEPFGDEDPRRATSVNNLAFILHVQGQYGAAEPHYREALAMRESALGPDHPDVAQSCNNLAELYRVLGRDADAEALHRRALKIREGRFGPNHPEIAQSLNNLGVLYASLGRYDEARPL
jgi:tetratricopeptide (TPR) repeat protein